MKKNLIKKMALIAIFSSIAIILDKVSIKIPIGISQYALKITFYGLPLLISGIVFKTEIGFLTGLITSIILQIFLSEFGITLTTPLWMIAPILWGTISSLIAKKVKDDENIINIILIIIPTSICVTIFNTLALYVDSLIFRYPSGLTFIIFLFRLLSSVLTSVIYIIIIKIIIKRIKQLKKKFF